MKEGRPQIAVALPDRGGGAMWWFLRLAVRRAGGIPLCVTPRHPRKLDGVDGLILGGGGDVGPHYYGEELRIASQAVRDRVLHRMTDYIVYPITWFARLFAEEPGSHADSDRERDELELALLQSAVDRSLPVFGICRGEQLINVFFGGTLHQELTGLYTEEPEVRTVLPRKQVHIVPGTLLACVLTSLPAQVNALHRQGVHRLGAGMRVAARDRNGIIQAIEHENLPFVLGVQWHPEFMPQSPRQQKLFHAFVRASAARAAGMAWTMRREWTNAVANEVNSEWMELSPRFSKRSSSVRSR